MPVVRVRAMRRRANGRLIAQWLGTTALSLAALPAHATNFAVGGGTIVTGQADSSNDQTGAGGPFILKPNTVSGGDTITITGVSLTNTSGADSGRALDFGYTLPSTGSYSVTMNGSTLAAKPGGASTGFLISTTGGTVTYDSTGGAANTISGDIGLTVFAGSGNGSAVIKTGADVINVSSQALTGLGQGTGTVSIDTVGATLTSAGTYGIVAQDTGGAITLGSLNGGLASTINVTNGYGIYSSSSGPIVVKLASTGVINAANGMFLSGGTVNVDSYGTINATQSAVIDNNGALTLTLESGSVTKGLIQGSNGNDQINIVTGATITNTTFNGGGGLDVIDLQGTGSATFNASTATNFTTLQKDGAGTWTVTGAASANFLVNAGTLTLAASGVVASTATVTVNGGTFDLNGTNQTFGTLSGTGGAITLGAGTLTTSSSASSTLASVINGSGNLVKSGTGTLILTGANVYTGTTTISGGSLQIGNGGTSGTLGTGTVTDTGTLIFNRSDSISVANVISGSGGVTQLGGNTTLTSANTYTGPTNVLGGSLAAGANGAFGVNSATTVASGAVLQLNSYNAALGSLAGAGRVTGVTGNPSGLTVGGNNSSTIFSGTIDGTIALTKAGTGTLILTGTNSYTAGTLISAGVLQIGAGGTSGSFPGGQPVADNAALVFNRSDSVTFGGAISGTGTVTQSAAGTTILTGANSYAGTTTIGAGMLQIGAGGTVGMLGTGAVTDNAALAFNRSDTVTIANTISGTGSAAQAGSGTIILTGANSYAGTTTIGAGTLQIGNGGATGSLGSGAVTDNAALAFNRSDTVTIANAISGTGSVAQSGSGTIILTGANSYAGTTTIGAGTLQIGSGGTTGSLGSGAVMDNAALAFNRSDTVTITNAISGTGGVTQSGSGTITLTGANSYAGTTTIGAGTLQIGNGGTAGLLGVGAVTDNAVLAFNRSDTVTIANAISGVGGVTQSGTGTVILGGASTSYTGATTVTAGTLSMVGSIASSSGVTVSSGATLAGTGTVPSTTIQSGGMLAPAGAGNVGTLSVKGNLTLAASSFTNVDVASSAADKIAVTGTAVLAGTLTANFISPSYTAGTVYTLLSSTGALSGTFSSYIVSGLASNYSSTISYNANNAFLTLSEAYSATSTANVNSGTVAVTGNQTVGGLASSSSSGTLAVSGGATLIVSQNSDTSYSGAIAGSGGLTKTGTGTLVLNGTNTYSGGTVISGGTLEVGDADHPDASITGVVTVASSGTLQGHGSIIGPVMILAGGNLQPGGTIGTTNVTSASFAPGSTYTVETNAAGQGNLTVASGAITIANGSALVVTPDAPLNGYARATTYTILQAAGGVTGTFSNTTSTLSGLLPSVSYAANTVSLTLIRPDLLAGLATSANQRGVATAIIAGGVSQLLTRLAPQSDAAVKTGFNQLSGDIHASLRGAAIEDSRILRTTVLGHLSENLDGVTVWGAGFGGYGGIATDGNAAGLHRTDSGVIAGVDMPLDYGFRAGIGGGYTDQTVNLAARASRASGTSGHLLSYVNWVGGPYVASLGGDYGWGSNQIVRTIAALNEVDGDHQSNTSGQIYGDAGYLFVTDEAWAEPHLGITHVSVTTGGFAETGGLGALTGSSKSDSQTYSTLGMRGAIGHYPLGDMILTPKIDVGWQHAFDRTQPSQLLAFSTTGQSFTVLGTPLAIDAAAVQAGIDLMLTQNALLSIGYDGSFSSRVQNNAIRGALTWRF